MLIHLKVPITAHSLCLVMDMIPFVATLILGNGSPMDSLSCTQCYTRVLHLLNILNVAHVVFACVHILLLCASYPEMAILDFNRILVDLSMQWQHVIDKKSNPFFNRKS